MMTFPKNMAAAKKARTKKNMIKMAFWLDLILCADLNRENIPKIGIVSRILYWDSDELENHIVT